MQPKAFQISVCYMLMVVCAVVLTVISPLIIEISKEFSLDLVQSGALITLMSAGFAIFAFAGGMLADRFGKKRVLLLSLAMIAAGALAFAFVQDFASACILVVLMGGGGGCVESLTNAILADVSGEKKRFHLNMIQAFFGIGAFAGPFFTGLCLSSGISWRMIYVATAVIAAAAAAVFAFMRLHAAQAQEKISVRVLGKLFTDMRFVILCICLALYTGSEIGAWAWMATFLKANLAFSIFDSSLAVGVFWLAMVAARAGITAIMRKFKTRTILLVLSFSSAAVTLGSAFVASREMGWVAIVMLGLCYSSIWPLIVSYASERYTSHTGTVFSILVGSGSVGSTLIPILIGVVGQYINIQTAMAFPMIFFLAIGMIFIFIERIKTKQAVPGKL
jgi:fucose permease